MPTIILLRHGEAQGGRLTVRGRKQIHTVAQRLRQKITERVLICSSTAKRALESAAILQEVFTAEEKDSLRTSWMLGDENGPQSMTDYPVNYVRRILPKLTDEEALVVVTHDGVVIELAFQFCSVSSLRSLPNPSQGQALVIDTTGACLIV